LQTRPGEPGSTPRPRAVLRLALAWMLCLLSARVGAQADSQYDGLPIMDVVIDGNVLVDHGLLHKNLQTRAGATYDSVKVNEDLHWMHDTYGIVVDGVPVTRVDDGVSVTFLLRRIRRFDEVSFEGNDEYSASTLRGVGRLSAEGGATYDAVTTARSLIKEHYLSKGYPFVQVDVREDDDDAGRYVAWLRVYEGPEVEVSDLRIEGLTAVDEGDVRDLLNSQPGFWSWLVGKDFVRTDVDRDILIVEDYVRREGYLDAQVSLDGLEWNEDRSEVVVTLLVDQGQRYTVRSIGVTGNTVFTDAELLAGAALEVGDPYRRPDQLRVQRAIRDKYGEKGYIDVTVRAHETFDLERPELDLEWRIEEGIQKKVRDIIVHGNAGTRDGVVRRYLTVYPGDIVDTRELRYSEDALVSLGYFTDMTGVPKVRVTTEETDDPEYVDVVVTVDDSSSGLFTFVVGAGSDSGIFAGVTVDKLNFDITRTPSSFGRFLREFFQGGEAFHGGGQRLVLEVVPGTQISTLDIVFQDPWLDESRKDPWGLTVELYDRQRIFSEYTQDSVGTGVFFDHRLNRETSVSFGPRLEQVTISDIDDNDKDFITGESTEFARAKGSAMRHVLEGSITYNAVDSLWEPTDGITSRLKLEGVGGPLGGDNDAVKAQFSNEWFVPAGEDDEGNVRVFHPRLALGGVEALGDEDELPFYENFFVGGGTGPFAVRGFDFQGVGPHQEMDQTPLGPRLRQDRGSAVGGRLAAVASLELLFPLVTDYNTFRDREETLIKGVIFVDVGNLLPDTNFGDLGTDIRAATGVGTRLRLPALGGITIKLDYAIVLAEQDEDETRPFSFELSRRF